MTSFRQSLRVVPDESFGSKLRSQRFAEGISQAELGKRFDVRQQTIGAWERGERPQARFLPALAQYVGLSDEHALRALLDADERMQPGHTPSTAPLTMDPTTARAVEALAALTESFAQRMQAGSELSDEESSILRDAVAALRRLTTR
jgi:transcriptional regulator with XRE-family HTH domain